MAEGVDERTRALAAESSNVVLAVHLEPTEDIVAERARASFDAEELAAFLNGGRKKLKRRAELAKLAASTEWGDKTYRYFLTRPQEYVGGLKAAMGIWDLLLEGKVSYSDGLELRQLVGFPGGLELHIGMFIPSLVSQATPEQQEVWLTKAQRLEIIGTYAQTELGHGTFVRGLETTATYDAQAQEFVIHSPTLTSTKWWPGGLGKTATHVVLMARLFADGKDHGPHGFIVQIRDMDTHLPLPRVKVGDIGPKFGYNGVDNGFLSFDHVRIPREQMLMRFAKVTPEGKYVAPPAANAKASYATMVYVRATIVEEAGSYLAKATTIAVRYNVVRRQTAAKAGELENQLLDYQNAAADLLPAVGAAYALMFMGRAAMAMYRGFERDRDRGDFSTLPELHAVLAGMKALATNTACAGMELCRRSCGGHGYSLLSGLPSLYASYVQNVTWEGDNNVLFLQTARYLVKNLAAAAEGKPVPGSSAYLAGAAAELRNRCAVSSCEGWLAQDHLLAAFRHRAARLCQLAADTLRAEGGGRLAFEGKPWNACTVDLIAAASAHCQLVLLDAFFQAIADMRGKKLVGESTTAVLQRLAALFGVTLVRQELGDWLQDGYLSGQQAAWLRDQQFRLLKQLRPEVVALVDAFGFEDYQLNSAIGRKDGNVYEALLAAAQVSPLNATEEGPAWEHVLKPRLAAAAAGGPTPRFAKL